MVTQPGLKVTPDAHRADSLVAGCASFCHPDAGETHWDEWGEIVSPPPIRKRHERLWRGPTVVRLTDECERPFLTAFGDKDPMTKPAEAALQARIPGAKGRTRPEIKGGAPTFSRRMKAKPSPRWSSTSSRRMHGRGCNAGELGRAR